MHVRKIIITYITNNSGCTEEDIVAHGVSSDVPEARITRTLARIIAKGKIIKAGNSHSMA